jgi:predicted Zn-ribbon and HTH transcriptional regulator
VKILKISQHGFVEIENYSIVATSQEDLERAFRNQIDPTNIERVVWTGQGIDNAQNALKTMKDRNFRYELKNAQDMYACQQCGEPFFDQSTQASICPDCQTANQGDEEFDRLSP